MGFIINELTLEKLDNKNLQELFLKIRSQINTAYRKKLSEQKIKNIQVDMCFIQREIDMRKRSRRAEVKSTQQ